MPNSWRDLGMVICDPLADLHPNDAELWLSLIMLAINHNELELVSTLIAARQFGQRVEVSQKFGYRLTKAEFFQEYFNSVYLKNRDALVNIIRELAADFPRQRRQGKNA